MKSRITALRVLVLFFFFFSSAHAFAPSAAAAAAAVGNSAVSSSRTSLSTTLYASSSSLHHHDKKNKRGGRSKRQERVGHLVQTELSRILHTGLIKGRRGSSSSSSSGGSGSSSSSSRTRHAEYLDDHLRQRISVVRADVSPDLKQARVSVSITTPKSTTGSKDDAAAEKRRAYSWLVRNTKPIRHSLAQRMSHLKTCPELTFVQVDVSAAVDVMYLIDQVAAGYKRQDLDNDNNIMSAASPLPTSGGVVVGGIDLDQAYKEEEWIEEDDFDL